MLMIMSLLNHCDIYMVLRGVQRSPHTWALLCFWGTASFCGELLLMENDLFWGPLQLLEPKVTPALQQSFTSVSLTLKEEEITQ